MIAVAAGIQPDPAGYGSHAQLGLAPCLMPMLYGYPCPTCGLTTSASLAVRGRVFAAFQAQPVGIALVLSAAAGLFISLIIIVTGRVWTLNELRVRFTHVLAGAVLVILGGWMYKILVGLAAGVLPYAR